MFFVKCYVICVCALIDITKQCQQNAQYSIYFVKMIYYNIAHFVGVVLCDVLLRCTVFCEAVCSGAKTCWIQ